MTEITYIPTTKEVATLIRARVVDQWGKRLDDFSAETNPTQAEVQEQINGAAQDVSEVVGDTVPADFESKAKRAVMYLAAASVEMSFFAEQAGSNNSTYERLMSRYNILIGQIGDSVAEEVDTSPGAEGAVGGFPPPSRWETRRW